MKQLPSQKKKIKGHSEMRILIPYFILYMEQQNGYYFQELSHFFVLFYGVQITCA